MIASTTPKPFVLVLMPFAEEFADIYELGIKQACIDAGAICERIDEQIFGGSILERIFSEISRATLIVADMTGRNPNVFYEVGYAHALGKHVILLTQHAEDIPFDLKHFPHIVYQGKIAYLKHELVRRVQWFIQNPTSSVERSSADLAIYVNGILLSEGPTAEVISKRPSDRKLAYLSVSVRNTSSVSLDPDVVCIGLEVAVGFRVGPLPINERERGLFGVETVLPTGGTIRNLLCPQRLYPEAWYTWSCELSVSGDSYPASGIPLQVVTYSPLGTRRHSALLLKERPIDAGSMGDAAPPK